MKLQIQAIFVLIALSVFSCAKEDASQVNPSSVYTSYAATYDDSTKTVSASATFNTGGADGTYLILDDSSEILFDSNNLTEQTDFANQVDYETSSSVSSFAAASGTHVFSYMDTSGSIYNNIFSFPLLVNAGFSTTTVSISSGTLTVNWASSDNIGSDSLDLVMERADQSGFITEPMSAAGLLGNTGNLVLTPSGDRGGWTPGAYNAQVCRSWNDGALNAPAEGGSLTATTCTATTQIVLTN